MSNLETFFLKLKESRFKIWKEENPLAGDPYTAMHIESVLDIIDLFIELGVATEHIPTTNFAIMLREDIMKSAFGYERTEDESGS